jgi:ABC-type Fe3+-hydroxamate transport system substrate-binding protein
MTVRMRWILAVGVVVVLAVAGVALASMGGEDENRPTKGTDLTAIRCPLEPAGETADGETQYRPAKDAFDTKVLIGLQLPDAEAKAAEHGCEIVVSIQDGVGLPVPIDVDPKRIYVYTENNAVTTIEGVGGGI